MLGTAQFGSKYGINNFKGKPLKKEIFDILDNAFEQNVVSLDTANIYGNSIELIGSYHRQRNHLFKILNKFQNIPRGKLSEHIMSSLNKLQIPSFEVCSFHSFDEYLHKPYLKDELLSLKNIGLINKIGISIYTNSELQKVSLDKDIEVIQLPYNLLDNQNMRGLYIVEAKQNNKEIHIRSAFLQGLFFMEENLIPQKLISLIPYIHKIRTFCENESISMYTLALSYAFYNKQIDQIVIGVNSKYQLFDDLKPLKYLKNAVDYINQNINVEETDLLLPTNWKL